MTDGEFQQPRRMLSSWVSSVIGFKLWDMKLKRMTISLDVHFDEAQLKKPREASKEVLNLTKIRNNGLDRDTNPTVEQGNMGRG